MKKIFITWDAALNDSDGQEGLPIGFSYIEFFWNEYATELTILAVDAGQWVTHAAFFSSWTEKP